MKKSELLNSIKIIVLGLVVGLGISFVVASTSSNPPGPNVPGPLNVGTSGQIKNASLGLDGIAVYGNSILGTDLTNTVKVSSLAFSNNGGDNGEKNVCADSSGTLKICGASSGNNAQCGTANGQVLGNIPATSLQKCASGSSIIGGITGAGTMYDPWVWACSIPNGNNANCSAKHGVCTGNYTTTVAGYCSGVVNGGNNPELNGLDCSTLALNASTCGTTLATHGCVWHQPVTTSHSCSIFESQTSCVGQAPACSWGVEQ